LTTESEVEDGHDDSTLKLSLEERKNQSMRDKIEHSIPVLAQVLPPKWLDKNFKKPFKDPSEDLYILNNGGFF
jgi:hypothetical protein